MADSLRTGLAAANAADPANGDYVPCYVINLASSTARRTAMEAQLTRLGVPFSIHVATDGRTLSEEQRRIVADDARALREYGPLSSAEIGCSLSHIAIYREMVERRIPCAMILEDDMCLASDFARLIDRNDPASLPNLFSAGEPAMVQLMHVGRVFRTGAIPAAGGRRLMRPHGGVWRTSAYFITLEAARRMAEDLYPVWVVADHWNLFEQRRLVKLHALVPNGAWESEHAVESLIAPGRVPRPRQRQPLARKLRSLLHDAFVRPVLVMRIAEFRQPPLPDPEQPAPEPYATHA